MINKRTVFVLGAGASCPYGYPSGSELRRLILYNAGSNMGGLLDSYRNFKINALDPSKKNTKLQQIKQFIETFKGTPKSISIDVFIANNPKSAPTGKYIIAFEIFRAEQNSLFGEEAQSEKERLKEHDNKKYVHGRAGFQGDDWYSYLFKRITDGLVGKDALPDFSNGNISFITFNYDRSLESFFYDSLRCLYSEVSEDRIIQILKQLKILHVYGQIAPLKWQNPTDYIEYKPQINESLLQSAADNLRTIYEEKKNPELKQAHDLLAQARHIFFLGFGYTKENMEVLGLPHVIPPTCLAYGTAFCLIKEEAKRIEDKITHGRAQTSIERPTRIESGLDCLMLLRKYLE